MFTIITVCYNSEPTVARTLRSVLSQRGVDLEYVILDGCSSDATWSIVQDYAKVYPGIIKAFSGPDCGMYDAMNKGIEVASGDYIGILNSDDYFASTETLETVQNAFLADKADCVYGNLVYVRRDRVLRYWNSGEPQSFLGGWMPPHPAFFLRSDVYRKFGNFRLDCGVNADYELMLRLLQKYRISATWVPRTLVMMESGGRSNYGIKSRINAIKNDRYAWTINGLRPTPFTIFLKKVRKLLQYVLRPSDSGAR